jgi:hypothetical protein
VITSQTELLLTAVQAQPGPVVTDTVCGPPAEGTFCNVGVSVKLHAAPSWVTFSVCPAMVSVPGRELVAVLAPTV